MQNEDKKILDIIRNFHSERDLDFLEAPKEDGDEGEE